MTPNQLKLCNPKVPMIVQKTEFQDHQYGDTYCGTSQQRSPRVDNSSTALGAETSGLAINEKVPHVELPVTFGGNRNIGVVSLEVIRVHTAKDKLTTRFLFSVSVKPEGENIFRKQVLLLHALPGKEK